MKPKALMPIVLGLGLGLGIKLCRFFPRSVPSVEDYSITDIFMQAVENVIAREGKLNLAKTCFVAAPDSCYCFGSLVLFVGEQLCG
jgi:hypothetical protein